MSNPVHFQYSSFRSNVAARQADSTMNILITDDHANVRRGLRELLVDAFPGTHFSEASNGDDALAQLFGSQPDLLLLDINMPGRSGFEVLSPGCYPCFPTSCVYDRPVRRRRGAAPVQAKLNPTTELRHRAHREAVEVFCIPEERTTSVRRSLRLFGSAISR